MENKELKIIICILILIIFFVGIMLVGEKLKDWKQKQYDRGIIAGRINGSIEARNFIIQDLCYDGMLTIGTDNETGRIIQVPLRELCGKK